MSNLISFLLPSALIVAFQVNASPLVVRCAGTKPWGNEIINVQIDVALPAKQDHVLIVNRQNGSRPDVLNYAVGVGRIEITETSGDAEISYRRKFIVTRMPNKYNALVGFYFPDNTYRWGDMNVLRADTWLPKKPFTHFEGSMGEIVTSHCE